MTSHCTKRLLHETYICFQFGNQLLHFQLRMGKGANEPVTDSQPTNLTDVYDAEAPQQKYSKSNGFTSQSEPVVMDSESESDVRVLSPDHQEALEKQRERREREPLLYCKIITRWPLQSFCKLISFIYHIRLTLDHSVNTNTYNLIFFSSTHIDGNIWLSKCKFFKFRAVFLHKHWT